MNSDFSVLQCTLCTYSGAATLFCSFKNREKCNAKIVHQPMFTMYTKVHRVFFANFGSGKSSFYRTRMLNNLIKVVKSYVFMYISELYDFRGQFLPCNLYGFLLKTTGQCTLKMAKCTEVHQGNQILNGGF